MIRPSGRITSSVPRFSREPKASARRTRRGRSARTVSTLSGVTGIAFDIGITRAGRVQPLREPRLSRFSLDPGAPPQAVSSEQYKRAFCQPPSPFERSFYCRTACDIRSGYQPRAALVRQQNCGPLRRRLQWSRAPMFGVLGGAVATISHEMLVSLQPAGAEGIAGKPYKIGIIGAFRGFRTVRWRAGVAGGGLSVAG